MHLRSMAFRHPWLLLLALGFVFLAPADASAATVTVEVRDFSFSPDSVSVQVGDTVRWVWISGSHTVTSGVNLGDPDLGDLFDAAMTSGNQVFEFTVTQAGRIDYLCVPHFGAGMTGVVMVSDDTPVDGITWGKIKRIFESTSPRRR